MHNILSSEILPPSDGVSAHGSDLHEPVLLAESDFNCVYRLSRGDRLFAVKAVRPGLPDAERHRRFLEHEYELLNSLQSPFIVSVWQIADCPPLGTCLWMDYVDGRTLDVFLEEKPDTGTRLQVLDEILQAVGYLHSKQIVHADLKPQNILVARNGNHVKLIDLGLADSDSWRESKLGNTRQFAAPEQLTKDGVLDQRTDIYALGHIIRLLFPRRYRFVAHRCLRPDPARRYQSVADLRRALRRRLLPLVGIFMLLALIGAVYVLWQPEPQPMPKTAPVVHSDTVTHHVFDTVTVATPTPRRQSAEKPTPPPTPVIFCSDSIVRLAERQNARLRDEFFDSIRSLEHPCQEEAQAFYYHYRQAIHQDMLNETRRYPGHEMEIAGIYSDVGRSYNKDIIDVVLSLPSRQWAEEHPGLPVQPSYKIVLDTITANVAALYDSYLDSIRNMPYKYQEFVYYYSLQAEKKASRARETDRELYPEKKDEIRNIYSNAGLDFDEQLTFNYPSIREADDATLQMLRRKLDSMENRRPLPPNPPVGRE